MKLSRLLSISCCSLISLCALGCSNGGPNDGTNGGVRVQGGNLVVWRAPSRSLDGSPLSDLKDFIVYYGTEPGNYSVAENAGGSTEHQLAQLQPGEIYYIAVTARDTSGNESPFSEELEYIVPPDDGPAESEQPAIDEFS